MILVSYHNKIRKPPIHPLMPRIHGKYIGLYNPNCIIITIEPVSDMNNQFKNHTNHSNTHPCVLVHCQLLFSPSVPVENPVFMLIDRISLKKARNKISVEETSYMTLPRRNLKFHRLDSFAYQPVLVGATTAMKQSYHRNLLNIYGWKHTQSQSFQLFLHHLQCIGG